MDLPLLSVVNSGSWLMLVGNDNQQLFVHPHFGPKDFAPHFSTFLQDRPAFALCEDDPRTVAVTGMEGWKCRQLDSLVSVVDWMNSTGNLHRSGNVHCYRMVSILLYTTLGKHHKLPATTFCSRFSSRSWFGFAMASWVWISHRAASGRARATATLAARELGSLPCSSS